LAAAWLCLSCSGALAKGDGRAFGDDLGRFHVSANLKSSTCGAGALSPPEDWKFDVFLSHEDERLFWNTGADAVEGTLAGDGRFELTSQVNVDSGTASCSFERTDEAAGTLDDTRAPRHLEGSLSYRFEAAGADCAGAAEQAGFAALPCRLVYGLTAKWISDR
jgi:hypothetical protein